MSEKSEETELSRITEASKRLGVSDGTLRKWVSEGIMKCIKLPSGERRFDRLEIERMKNMMNMKVYCPVCKSYNVKIIRSDDRILLAIVCSSCGKYVHLGKINMKMKDGDIIPSEKRVKPSQQMTITIPESTTNTIPMQYHGTIVLEGREYGIWEILDKSLTKISDDEIEVQIYCENDRYINFDSTGINEIVGEMDGGSDKIRDVHIFRGRRLIYDLDPSEEEIDVTPKNPHSL